MYDLDLEKYNSGIAHNFATSSQPFFHDYSVLKNVEEAIPDEAVIFIPISNDF
jgi:hypothetical protein